MRKLSPSKGRETPYRKHLRGLIEWWEIRGYPLCEKEIGFAEAHAQSLCEIYAEHERSAGDDRQLSLFGSTPPLPRVSVTGENEWRSLGQGIQAGQDARGDRGVGAGARSR